MKKYCVIYTEYQGLPAGDPAVIPLKAVSKGYNLLEVFENGENATVESDPGDQELRFVFEGTGYAIPSDGETYATDWHATALHPQGLRLIISLEDDIF